MVLSLIGMLAIMVVVLVLAYLFTRWIAVHGAPNFAVNHTNETFCVLRQVNVGRSERLLLVRVHERCLVIGVTAGSMNVLAELSKEESDALLNVPEPPSFMESLQSAAAKIPRKK